MFRNPFSFSGRIRRLEYGLSYLAVIACLFILQLGFIGPPSADEAGSGGVVLLVFLLPAYWFMLAQGAKRCHDRGRSGWYQLLPFYGLLLLFYAGDAHANEYGPNPKAPADTVDIY
jgi:uncharacterized membrane protein YhaH (DUF805 family)